MNKKSNLIISILTLFIMFSIGVENVKANSRQLTNIPKIFRGDWYNYFYHNKQYTRIKINPKTINYYADDNKTVDYTLHVHASNNKFLKSKRGNDDISVSKIGHSTKNNQSIIMFALHSNGVGNTFHVYKQGYHWIMVNESGSHIGSKDYYYHNTRLAKKIIYQK
ncbi:hypothetical protein [Apilactobacillus ozensis]|uniref:hypothetical protein n=1 Tax=Apilactobacillus ozensis TaxID=866801 RepID=UPI0006D26803|nr:hypothetical protein [Apilactobacillus ozensis]